MLNLYCLLNSSRALIWEVFPFLISCRLYISTAKMKICCFSETSLFSQLIKKGFLCSAIKTFNMEWALCPPALKEWCQARSADPVCMPFKCQAPSIRACCCSPGFHPVHKSSRPFLHSPPAHQKLIFHAGGPATKSHKERQVGGRRGVGGMRGGQGGSIWAHRGCWGLASTWNKNDSSKIQS